MSRGCSTTVDAIFRMGAMTDQRPLSIAHVCFTALPATVGGLETVVDTLLRQQSADGHEVALVTRWRQAKAARAALPEYRVLALPPNLQGKRPPFRYTAPTWPVSTAVSWHQARHKFDIWHAHWIFPTGCLVRPALDRIGAPLVMTAHGADVNVDEATGYGYRQFPDQDLRVRREIAEARHLTAVSPHIEDQLVSLGAAPRQISTIPNGVNYQAISAANVNTRQVRADYGVPAEAKMILTVARNQPSKGLHHIAGILRRLGDPADIYWVVVGDGGDALRPGFQKLGLSDRVRFAPTIRREASDGSTAPPEGVIRLYHAADLFVFPTYSEAFGLVALEAMAAGLPVVASDVGGLSSLITSGENGVLAAVGDEEAFAKAITDLLVNKAFGQSISHSARQTAAGMDWKTVSGAYVSLYRDILKGARG